MVLEWPRGPIPENHGFTEKTDVSEPIELQLVWGPTAAEHVRNTQAYQLTAWRSERGTVAYSLVSPGGTSCALQNVQSHSFFPGKAKPGWQLQVLDWAAAGLYKIASVS
jgi:hypothetical protein